MVYFIESFFPHLPYSFYPEGGINATFSDYYNGAEQHFLSVTKSELKYVSWISNTIELPLYMLR